MNIVNIIYIMVEKTQKCNKCNKILPLSNFNLVSFKSGYYRKDCKKCRSEFNKQQYLKKKQQAEDEALDKMNREVYKKVFGEDLD
jgi:hypothetical protein